CSRSRSRAGPARARPPPPRRRPSATPRAGRNWPAVSPSALHYRIPDSPPWPTDLPETERPHAIATPAEQHVRELRGVRHARWRVLTSAKEADQGGRAGLSHVARDSV